MDTPVDSVVLSFPNLCSVEDNLYCVCVLDQVSVYVCTGELFVVCRCLCLASGLVRFVFVAFYPFLDRIAMAAGSLINWWHWDGSLSN